MVEQVRDRTLYHVTVTKPYKQAFALNQTVRIGDDDCPFFRFYESVREYPVEDGGNIVQVKAIRWLSRVRDGSIQPRGGIHPQIAVDVALHYVMLCRELIMEQVRTAEFNSVPPSRQKCLYTCETLEQARYWKNRLRENGSICELTCTGTIQHADAGLLLGDSEPLSVTRARARAYWNGETGDNAEMETLFVGDVTVTAKDL